MGFRSGAGGDSTAAGGRTKRGRERSPGYGPAEVVAPNQSNNKFERGNTVSMPSAST